MNAAQAGDLRRAGHRVSIFKGFLHAPGGEAWRALLEALKAEGPWDLLVVDRVWAREPLTALQAAAGGARVVVTQWESPSAWPEVSFRVAPVSRKGLLALADAVAARAPVDALPNVWTRDGDQGWARPQTSEPLLVAREMGAPLDFAYDRVRTIGLDPQEAEDTRYLLLNMGCPYRGAENTSGFLADLTPDTAWGDRGCTFCNVGPYEAQTAQVRRDLMAGQLAALAPHGPYRRLVVQDEYVFRDLDLLVELVLEHAPPGVELMVRARVEDLFRCEAVLLRALDALGDHGTLTPYLIGFENFSDAELRRYNKGQTAAAAEAAALKVLGWADAWPNFGLSRSQGFILFGPWTTLDDLRANALALRRCSFDRLRGGLTRSKLRLNPDAALLTRARADGLLVETHDRADEDNAAETGYQAEIPYRFADPNTARVWELLNGPAPVQGRDEIGRLDVAIARVEAERGARP
ncbi:MAG: hypothetical protein R3F39_04775 [Myxococcota bacterium]